MDHPRFLRDGVWRAYSAVGERPEDEHPFAVGRRFAEGLGYPAEWLDSVPEAVAAAFTGVSNVAVFADIMAGAQVLDLGCGAGLDALIAAQRAGPNGGVLGIDFSRAMLARAQAGAAAAGLGQARFCQGDAEALPIDSGSIDVGLVNGIFNLNPARAAIFAELARVVKPDGCVYAAELILREPLPAGENPSLDDWFA